MTSAQWSPFHGRVHASASAWFAYPENIRGFQTGVNSSVKTVLRRRTEAAINFTDRRNEPRWTYGMLYARRIM